MDECTLDGAPVIDLCPGGKGYERWSGLECSGGRKVGGKRKMVDGAGESDEITRAFCLHPRSPTPSWAGSGFTCIAFAVSPFHVGKRSSGAPIFTQKPTHAMDQTTVLYALVSFLVLLISSVSFFNQNSGWDFRDEYTFILVLRAASFLASWQRRETS